jgi:hypothetical protein
MSDPNENFTAIEGKDLDRVIVYNTDGTEETFDKGMVCQWDSAQGKMTMKFIHMSGAEAADMMETMLYAVAKTLKQTDAAIEIDPEEEEQH